jgi:uncharacterized Zn finger protein
MRYQTTRVYAGDCPHCGHEMRRAIDDTQGQTAKPGVLLRCAECRDVSFAHPESATEVRDGPEWFVDSEQVVEWFEYGDAGGER